MPPDADVQALEVRLLLEGIHARYGYDFRGYSPSSMRRRVAFALAKSGLAHLGELQHAVLRDAAAFARVLADLTVQVTDMFRDPAFYRAFRARVVPVLRTYPRLKIWHVGCATGEEVYASAILLLEEGLYDRTQIYATDLSRAALDRAAAGIYPRDQARAFAENYELGGGKEPFAQYHRPTSGGAIAMNASLRRNVSFFQHDVVCDHVFGEMHVIFCRNVLIYFGKELRRRVLGKLAQGLCPGGFLCLGASERLSGALAGEAGATRDPEEDLPFADFAPEERIYRHTS